MASPAQCRSSMTRTIGPFAAMSSSMRVQAAKLSSRSDRAASRPRSGRRRCRSQGRSAPCGRDLLEPRLDGGDVVGVEDAGVSLENLAQGPERHPLSVGEAAPLAPRDARERSRGSAPTRARRDSCRCPAHPTMSTELPSLRASLRGPRRPRSASSSFSRSRNGVPVRLLSAARCARRDRRRATRSGL